MGIAIFAWRVTWNYANSPFMEEKNTYDDRKMIFKFWRGWDNLESRNISPRFSDGKGTVH